MMVIILPNRVFSARIASNTQLILQYESGIKRSNVGATQNGTLEQIAKIGKGSLLEAAHVRV
ncbi:MAG: hypothetical protein JSC189_000641 [Candidatus Tokpelaia sp. JSC189]|nr:MAG: hypothetical protein JSC189_000641 [Candidatus Tokpelaia sp. JSC189]